MVIQKAKIPEIAMNYIFTIGYEGTDIDRFITTLKLVGVNRLADVRAVALSRKKGFSKKKLAERLIAEGIDYAHFQKLGDPKSGREAARDGRYDEFRAIYDRHIDSSEARNALHQLKAFANEKPTCLLCFERDPELCHRSIVAKKLGLKVFDLIGNDPDYYVRKAAEVPYHNFSQSIAAA